MNDDLFRILLVDDDSLDAGFLLRAFEDKSDRVAIKHCEDGESAVAALSEEPFDVVILDINLNGESGIDLIGTIRKLELSGLVPIVMFTSSTNETDIRRSYAAGANAYVEKPLSLQEYRHFASVFLDFWASTALVVKG